MCTPSSSNAELHLLRVALPYHRTLDNSIDFPKVPHYCCQSVDILVNMIRMVNMITTTTLPATIAKTQFAELIGTAAHTPVTITRNNRAVAVVLSPAEYQRLMSQDDAYWGEQAEKVQKHEFLSSQESADFLVNILHAND